VFQNQTEKAVRRVRLQVAKVPDNANYHFLLGQLLLADHRASDAEAEAEKAVALDKSNSGAMLLLARARRDEGHLDEAAAAFEHLMQENPRIPNPVLPMVCWRSAEETGNARKISTVELLICRRVSPPRE